MLTSTRLAPSTHDGIPPTHCRLQRRPRTNLPHSPHQIMQCIHHHAVHLKLLLGHGETILGEGKQLLVHLELGMSKLKTGVDGIDCPTLRETLGGTGPRSDGGQITLHLLCATLGTGGSTCLGQADKTWKQSAKDDLEVEHQ